MDAIRRNRPSVLATVQGAFSFDGGASEMPTVYGCAFDKPRLRETQFRANSFWQSQIGRGNFGSVRGEIPLSVLRGNDGDEYPGPQPSQGFSVKSRNRGIAGCARRAERQS